VQVKNEPMECDGGDAAGGGSGGGGSSGRNTPSGMILHKGALVDIDKLIQQLQRSEKARASTEQKLKDMQEELDQTKDMANTSEKTLSKVSNELHEYKKRLNVSEDSLKKSHESVQRYLEVVQLCHEKTGTLLRDSVKNGYGSGSSNSRRESRGTSAGAATEELGRNAESEAKTEEKQMENGNS